MSSYNSTSKCTIHRILSNFFIFIFLRMQIVHRYDVQRFKTVDSFFWDYIKILNPRAVPLSTTAEFSQRRPCNDKHVEFGIGISSPNYILYFYAFL